MGFSPAEFSALGVRRLGLFSPGLSRFGFAGLNSGMLGWGKVPGPSEVLPLATLGNLLSSAAVGISRAVVRYKLARAFTSSAAVFWFAVLAAVAL